MIEVHIYRKSLVLASIVTKGRAFFTSEDKPLSISKWQPATKYFYQSINFSEKNI
jgi:hypothetical protein